MAPIESSENEDQSQDHQLKKQSNEGDEDVLKFMDSLDAYLRLIDSLSSTLRQGWFDFASARYSMGASRVNSALLDLKEHPAATSLEVREGGEPHFTLCKWTTDTEEMKDNDNGLQQECNSIRQLHKETSQVSEVKEESSPVGGPSATTDDRVQKGRSRSLAVFGTLISPKLRAAQLSFETALETAVEIANARASMLSTLDQVQELMSETRD